MKNHLSKNTAKFIAVAIMSLTVVFLNPAGVFNPVRRILVEIAYPFQKMFYFGGQTISKSFAVLGSIGDLKTENENLFRENNALASKVATLRALETAPKATEWDSLYRTRKFSSSIPTHATGTKMRANV